MFEGIEPAEFVTVVEETRRDDSAMHARRMTAIAGLLWHRTADAEGFDTDDPSYALITGFARTTAEVGAALNITPAAASRLVSQAEALDTRLPRMLDLLARHQIDWADVTTIIARTACVDHDKMATLDAALAQTLTRWNSWSATRLRNAVDAAIATHDPDGATQRRTTADTDARVSFTALPNGMARVNIYTTAPAGLKFDKLVTTMATAVCTHDPRTLQQRRVAAIDTLAEGRFHLHCACGRDNCPIEPPTPEAPKAAPRFVINVVASAATLTGASDAPGYLDSYGVIDAVQVRDLADNGAQLRPTENPTQTVTEILRHDPSPAVARWIRARALTCSFPGCNRSAWTADLDHSTAFDHHNPIGGGWTTPDNLSPLCRQHHRLKTFDTGWHDHQLPDGTRHWTSPTGRTYRSTPDGADLFDDIAAAMTPPTPRPRNHRLDKTRRTAATRAGLAAKRAANTETQRINRARAWEIDLREWRNNFRFMNYLFKGTPSTSPFCTWVNDPDEDPITADWKPPPLKPTTDHDEPPF